jgi:hypothetical protein
MSEYNLHCPALQGPHTGRVSPPNTGPNMRIAAILSQVLLLAYHQVTTQVDCFPFNGVRFYNGWEKVLECAVNGVLMSLAPLGFAFDIRGLKWFGVVYYFILFVEELRVWWLPYFFGPSKSWQVIYERLHARTIKVLPARGTNPVPNLEHTILHGLTLITAIATLFAFCFPG